MDLRQTKQQVRKWVRTHFSDQKLAEVYAFNRDGKMGYFDFCGCLLGVTEATALHNESTKALGQCDGMHYRIVRARTGLGVTSERAYFALGVQPGESDYPSWTCNETNDKTGGNFGRRQRRLSAILRAEMRVRERKHATENREAQVQDLVRV